MLVIEAPQQRRASLAVLAGGLHLADSAAADETQNQGKQNRTHGGDHNADEHALRSFFFSSRRRHTRLQGDWSSDVCSSDLILKQYESPTMAMRLYCFRM